MKNKERMCFGIIIGTRAYFNSELAKDVRKQLLKTLADEGYDYVILPEDALLPAVAVLKPAKTD